MPFRPSRKLNLANLASSCTLISIPNYTTSKSFDSPYPLYATPLKFHCGQRACTFLYSPTLLFPFKFVISHKCFLKKVAAWSYLIYPSQHRSPFKQTYKHSPSLILLLIHHILEIRSRAHPPMMHCRIILNHIVIPIALQRLRIGLNSSDASGADVLWLGSVDRSPNRQPVESFDWPKSGAAEAIRITG